MHPLEEHIWTQEFYQPQSLLLVTLYPYSTHRRGAGNQVSTGAILLTAEFSDSLSGEIQVNDGPIRNIQALVYSAICARYPVQ